MLIRGSVLILVLWTTMLAAEEWQPPTFLYGERVGTYKSTEGKEFQITLNQADASIKGSPLKLHYRKTEVDDEGSTHIFITSTRKVARAIDLKGAFTGKKSAKTTVETQHGEIVFAKDKTVRFVNKDESIPLKKKTTTSTPIKD